MSQIILYWNPSTQWIFKGTVFMPFGWYVQGKLKYETDLTAAMPSDQSFTLKIETRWGIQNVP